MAIRKKLKAPAFEDMSIKEAEALLAQVGEQQRLVGVIEATRDNHLTAIKKKASEELAPLRKNVRNIELQVSRLEKDLEKIDAALADPKLYEKDPVALIDLGKQRSNNQKTTKELLEKWLTMSAELEAAAAPKG